MFKIYALVKCISLWALQNGRQEKICKNNKNYCFVCNEWIRKRDRMRCILNKCENSNMLSAGHKKDFINYNKYSWHSFKTVNFTSIDNFRSFLLKPMTRAQRQNITDKGISESYINNARKVFTISEQPWNWLEVLKFACHWITDNVT